MWILVTLVFAHVHCLFAENPRHTAILSCQYTFNVTDVHRHVLDVERVNVDCGKRLHLGSSYSLCEHGLWHALVWD